jgi:hypothetical protein
MLNCFLNLVAGRSMGRDSENAERLLGVLLAVAFVLPLIVLFIYRKAIFTYLLGL